ncbi:MAG: hydrogenase, partial [Leptospiraceae bacterium]|nr:hydrogenase [Leptospiraceae bacterium]
MANLTVEDKEYLQPEMVRGGKQYSSVNDDVVRPIDSFPTKLWWGAFSVALVLLTLLFVELGYLISAGIGIVGVNIPVGWGTFIINFVFW